MILRQTLGSQGPGLGAITRHPVSACSQQAPHRQAESLAGDIPERDIDGAAQLLRWPGQALQHQQVVPQALAGQRVAADEVLA